MEKHSLSVQLSQNVLRGLRTYKRNDIYPKGEPPAISIDLTCQMHPWLKELLDAFNPGIDALSRELDRKLLLEAIFTVETEE